MVLLLTCLRLNTYHSNIQQQAMKSLIIVAALLAVSLAISIPVTSQHEKCMIVYSRDADDYLKIDVKFEKFTGQTDQEYYLINLHNTETNHIETFNVTEGLFRREIQLTQNVIYKLCMKIVLNRYGSSQVQAFVEYNSAVKHNVDSSSKVEIPGNLLKIKDLQETYTELITFDTANKHILVEYARLAKEQDSLFKEQEEKISKIEWITIIEFLAITAFGIYQFFRLRGIIDSKQRT